MTLPLHRLAGLAAGDPALTRFGKGFGAAILVGDGANDWLIEIRDGAVTQVTPGPLMTPRTDIRIRAASDVWTRFLEPVPPPGFHDLFAMLRYRRIVIEGDMKLFTAYLFFIKRLFALLRGAEARA